jgi:hypothetical protein
MDVSGQVHSPAAFISRRNRLPAGHRAGLDVMKKGKISCPCRQSNPDSSAVQPVVFFFFSFSGWDKTESTWYVGHCWPIVPAPDDRWWWLWSSWWNEDWQGKPKYSEKTCPSISFSTTNPTWPDLGSNPGRRDGKPATNRLSYGTAYPVD